MNIKKRLHFIVILGVVFIGSGIYGAASIGEDLESIIHTGQGQRFVLKNGDLMPGAYTVTNEVDPEGTPEELQTILDRYPEFKVYYGGRLGWTLMKIFLNSGNEACIRKLSEIDPRVVDADISLHNEGYSSIIYAASLSNHEKSLKMVKLLYNLGAHLNFSERGRCELTDSDKWYTALSYSIESPEKKELTKFLLDRGAVMYGGEIPIAEDHMTNLQVAMEELKEERNGLQLFSRGELHKKGKDIGRKLHQADLCHDLATYIVDFLRHDPMRLIRQKNVERVAEAFRTLPID